MQQIKTGSLAPTGGINDCRTIAEGVLILLTYLRTQLFDFVFEMFLRSVTGANKNKQNSLILFIVNVRDFKAKQKDLLLIDCDLYTK